MYPTLTAMITNLREAERLRGRLHVEVERLRYLRGRARKPKQRRSLAQRLHHAQTQHHWKAERVFSLGQSVRYMLSPSHQMLLAAGCEGNNCQSYGIATNGERLVVLISHGKIPGEFVGRGVTHDDACRDIIRQIALLALER